MVFIFLSDLFHLAQIFLDSVLLFQVTRLHLFIYLFLWLNDTQVYMYTTSFSIPLSLVTYIVSMS